MTAQAEEKITLTNDMIKEFEEHEKQFLSSDYIDNINELNKMNQDSEEEKSEEIPEEEVKEEVNENVEEGSPEETESEQDEQQEEEQSEEEVQDEESKETTIDWEKRAKDNQSSYTKSQQELADLKKQIANRDKLLNRFNNRIKRDEFGNPIDWDFSDVNENKKEIPQPPTEEEWDTDPKTAAEKYADHRDYLRDQRLEQREQERNRAKSDEEAKAEFTKTWNESDVKASEEYPELLDQNSEIFKEVVSIVKDKPEFEYMPDAPLILAELAAARLGIKPKSKQQVETTTNTSKKIITKKPNKIMAVGKGGSSNSKASSGRPEWLSQYEADMAKFRTG